MDFFRFTYSLFYRKTVPSLARFFFLASMSLISFSAFSTQSYSPFAEPSLIFILGLSIPIISFALLLRTVLSITIKTHVTIVIATVLLLYLSIILSQYQFFIISLSVLFYLFLTWFLTKKLLLMFANTDGEEKISTEELFAVTHDPATNLPTPQQALKYFNSAMKSHTDKKYAAVVFKPINFQQVNTVLGHQNSDILLLQLAYCLQNKVSSNNSLLSFGVIPEITKLARLQSLHFLVVYDLSTTNHETKAIIDDLCHQLSSAVPDAMSFKSFSLNFELAFGVAITGDHGSSVEEVISHAGDALLLAERNQKTISYFDNSVVIYTEQQLAKMERLRKDIEDDNLRWLLQPQINIADNHILSFELKVHWHMDDNASLELADFIELAEHSGEVYSLTKQMVKQAFKALFELHKVGVYKTVSVNISSKNLLEDDLVDYIEQQITNFNISGKYLLIELSEQVMLSSEQRAKRIIDQLKTLDITIAISGFSGSYESLRYLRKMSIHQVKIKCNRLTSRDDNRADKAIVNSLITLTRSMKLPLIGTHIDNNESVTAFKAMGGMLVQGNIINRGIALDEISIWLEKWFNQHPEAKPKGDSI
ncbi:MAG: EAL domain-containing protein [Colwellia sp.]